MSRLLFTASLAFSLACAGGAFAAQTSTTACGSTQAKAAQAPPGSTTTSMADTSSDMGSAGSGASSASIATGPTDKVGVMTPCAPGTTGQAQSGAVPTPTTP
jgi:hypothetical protein